MSNLKTLVDELDAKTAKGDIHDALAQYYAEDCTFTEAAGGALIWNEVLVRRWRDGKVVGETFYNASA